MKYYFSDPSSAQYQGCFADDSQVNGDRVLPNIVSVSGDLTVDKCLETCRNAGYTFAGMEVQCHVCIVLFFTFPAIENIFIVCSGMLLWQFPRHRDWSFNPVL